MTLFQEHYDLRTNKDLNDEISVLDHAFAAWSKHTNLKFVRNILSYNSDIIISFSPFAHRFVVTKLECLQRFDGRGGVLAYAYSPTENQKSSLEIDLDAGENWWYSSLHQSTNDYTPLYPVLIHEIGHVFGLRHSYNPDSIMYPWFQSIENKSDALDSDDIAGIQRLYGSKKATIAPYTTITTTTDTNAADRGVGVSQPADGRADIVETDATDPCGVNDLNTFLIVDDRIYVFYKNLVWAKKRRR